MNIRDKRINTEVNRVIKESLSNGYLPTSNEVIGAVSRYISGSDLSAPLYKYHKIYDEFSIEDLNRAITDLAKDLGIAYESILELYDEIDSQVSKFDTEKRKYDYRTSQLESQLYNLANQYGTSGYMEIFAENIIDMQNFNVQSTDCDINLQSRDITLRRLEDKPYDGPMTITLSTSGDLSTNGRIEDYMDKQGVYWQAIVKKQTQEATSLSILIDFGRTLALNKLEMEMPLLKPAEVSVSTSQSSDSWILQFKEKVPRDLVANMQGTFRYLKIDIRKEEADKVILGTYEYHFLVDTLKLFSINYANRSTLITSPIKMNSNINKVSIVDDSQRPNSTDIKYYVALDSSTPHWVPITPLNDTRTNLNKVVSFNTVEVGRYRDVSLRTDISQDAYLAMTANGQGLYTIQDLNDIKIIRSAMLKGINSWKVEKLTGIESIPGPIGKGVFSKNQNSTNLSIVYQPMSVGKIMRGDTFTEPCVLKYTAAIECPKGVKPKAAQLVSNYPVNVYLNGEIIYSGTPTSGTEVTYPFREKKNILEIIINVNAMNTEGETPTAKASLETNMDISKLSTQVYGESEPMREVSFFNLKYNTNNEKNVYALKRTSNGYQLLIKDSDLSIAYRFYYDYVISDATELLLKAELMREFDTVNVTPRLRKFEIRVI